MIKFLKTLIEVIFWLQIFLSPTLLFTVIALIVLSINPQLKLIAGMLVITGLILGISVAERIRRKYGCSTYMGNLLKTGSSKKINKE